MFVLGGWFWTYWALRNVPPPLVLHYDAVSGINQRGDLSEISWFAMGVLVILTINSFLAGMLLSREKFLAYFLAGSTFFMAGLIFIGFAAIIHAN